ncbi:BatD family protein [Flavobacterium agricola]|uniref:BatD family protein n=1 Tax=Flavobacterium agricola TaxID=2870839 RepID=A0ABY6M1G0_9FLAO|nr:BatD family protein [Flavobacterium agricola]UYW01063.1 BatD family protein [Flavobacterium agricola]
MKHYLILLLLVVQNAFAQFTYEAKVNKSTIGINERLRVDFVMNNDGDNFKVPGFEGFNVIMGPNQSISYKWINGKKTYNKTYTYYLEPTKKGTFVIKPSSIEFEGQIYKSNPIEVKVGDAVQEEEDPYQGYWDPFGFGNSGPPAPQQAQGKIGEGAHLVAYISNDNPYVNEPITVVYKLYVSPYVNVYGSRETATPKFNNFWSQFIDMKDFKPTRDTYNGEVYTSIEIRKVVLYPQKAGSLALEPLRLEIDMDVPSGQYDFFGRPAYKQGTKTVVAGNKSIQVKPLPEAGKPADFAGAVGEFTFSVTPSKTTLRTDESLDVLVEVAGRGNLKLFSLPQLVLPPSLEVFDPEHNEQVQTPLSGMVGKISDRYTILPQQKGTYVIKPMSFSYFDLASKTYKTITTDEIELDVTQGQQIAANGAATNSDGKQEVVAKDEFAYIKTNAKFTAVSDDFLGSNLFYLLIAIAFIGIPVVIIYRGKKEARDADVVGNKIRKSDRLAKKYLSEAKKCIGNKEEFYVAMERSLHNFLKAKLSIETSEMSTDNINELLLSKNAKSETITDFIKLKQNCEMARYAPSSKAEMQQDYELASQVITQLNKQL